MKGLDEKSFFSDQEVEKLFFVRKSENLINKCKRQNILVAVMGSFIIAHIFHLQKISLSQLFHSINITYLVGSSSIS